jgi:hypothetical protein
MHIYSIKYGNKREPKSCFGQVFNFKLSQGTLTEGRTLSTVDLLPNSSLDKLQTFFAFFKTTHLNEEVNGTEPSPSGSVPW